MQVYPKGLTSRQIPYDLDLAPTLQGSDKQQRKGQHDTKQQKQIDVCPNAAMIQNQRPNRGSPADHTSSTPFNAFPRRMTSA